jgi:acetolactate synthase-1/2/3 large subunit
LSSTVARYIAETLLLAGTRTAFGVPAAHSLGLWAAAREAGLPLVGCRTPGAAAHAADGYGRTGPGPGLVLLSSGPGALAALAALGEATVSSSPVVAVATTIPGRLVGGGKGHLHEAADPLPAYGAVTKLAGRAATAADVPDLLGRVLAAARSGRPGAALLEVPVDVLDAQLDAVPEAPPVDRPAPAAPVVAEATTLLRLAARPVIWAGGGVHRAGASAELLALAERLGAPVVTTFLGKGAIPERHPLSIGTLMRFPAVAATVAQADLLVAVGTRFSGMSTSNWRVDLPPQTIHVDADPGAIGRNYPVRLPVVADAKAALAAVLGELAASGRVDRPDRTQEVAGLRRAAVDRARREGAREMAILEAVHAALPPGAVTVLDVTIASHWAAAFLPTEEPGTFHTPYGFGTPGFSLAAALGVAAAAPSRPVVAFAGDGSFAVHAPELATARACGSRVTVLVFNDGSCGGLRPLARARYGSDDGLDVPGPDLVALAAAYGLPAVRADEPADVGRALADAVSSPGPHVVEVPGAWAVPPPASAWS